MANNNIKVERARLDFNQSELAEALGVTPQTMCKWEQDLSTCPTDKLIALRNIFGGCSLDYIVGLTDNREGIK